MKNVILKVSKLNKVFKVNTENIHVLKDISFELNKGDFLTLFGPSGSGKSTLLNIILGLEAPTSGSVNLLDYEITELENDELAAFRKEAVGIIYQQPNWIKSLNVIENVAFPLILKGESRTSAIEKANKYIEMVGMSKWKKYNPTNLSAGQQQKISLARALINNPEIIIADEPTGNLDFKSSVELMNIFRDLVLNEKTIIMVTHNLDNLNYSNKIARIFDGRIVEIIENDSQSLAELKKRLIDAELNDTVVTALLPKSSLIKDGDQFSLSKLFNTLINNALHLPIDFLKSVITLTLYFFDSILNLTINKVGTLKRIYSVLNKNINGFIDFISPSSVDNIKTSSILELSAKNVFSKKTRAYITIGGIIVGIGFTTLLFSIGFGLEKIVLDRVRDIEQLKQFDVFPSVSSNIFLNQTSLDNIQRLYGIDTIYPIISVAGKFNYNESTTDVVVYGVDDEFPDDTRLGFIGGESFTNQQTTLNFVNLETFKDELKEDNLQVTSQNSANNFVIDLPEDNNQAIVNESLLKALNISTQNALNTEIKLSYSVSSNLVDNSTNIRSSETKYTIVGVVSDIDSPVVYVAKNDLIPLGIQKYSQAKIIATSKEDVPTARQNIEALGFKTSSIIDTIEEIESLFATLRMVFGAMGIVALFIASLGMFNTLTISLLERIREVGLMKAIGMYSADVRKLFIIEAALMGYIGGIGGILAGTLAGQGISSVFMRSYVSRGGEYISITYLPIDSALLLLFVSVIISFLTGFYPAFRATTISPITALKNSD